MNIKEIKHKIEPIIRRYDAEKVAVFGSAARGDMHEKSDIDLLIDIRKSMSLLDMIGIKQDFEDALGCKVDLVEYSTLKARLRERVLNEQIVIYDKGSRSLS